MFSVRLADKLCSMRKHKASDAVADTLVGIIGKLPDAFAVVIFALLTGYYIGEWR